MSELISGKEALIALVNGEEVQHFNKKMATFGNLVKDEEWGCCDELTISDFNSDLWAFRLKPRTVNLNGIEVPAPFEPKEGEECCYVSDQSVDGYHTISYNPHKYSGLVFGLYRPSDIKQVVAALRSIFNPE